MLFPSLPRLKCAYRLTGVFYENLFVTFAMTVNRISFVYVTRTLARNI